MNPQWFWFIPLFIALGVAAATDLRSRRIPNSLTLALASAGLLQAVLLPARAGGIGLGGSAAGLALGLLVPFVFFAINALGAGDVKLLAAVGAWVGPHPILIIMLVAAIIGGVLAIVQGLMQRRLALVVGNTALLAMNLLNVRRFGIAKVTAMNSEPPTLKHAMPYGVAIALATAMFITARAAGWVHA
jgi:prepilin peptidase CpaA